MCVCRVTAKLSKRREDLAEGLRAAEQRPCSCLLPRLRSVLWPRMSSYIHPKHAPHSYAHAKPWDKFQGKAVGRKEVSRKKIFVPGHKGNADLESGLTSSGAIGAHAGIGRAPAVETSRRNFGAWAQTTNDDILGPVDLPRERTMTGGSGHAPPSRLEEPPPDTLRWNPESQRGGLAGARRRQVERLMAAEQEPPVDANATSGKSAARVAARRKAAVPEDPFHAGGQRARSERALKHEHQLMVRQQIADEAKAYAAAPRGDAMGVMAANGYSGSGVMTAAERAAALTDPRVKAALDHALNKPNRVAADHNKGRNTTRISAERRF